MTEYAVAREAALKDALGGYGRAPRRPSHERDRAIINELQETVRVLEGHVAMLRGQVEELRSSAVSNEGEVWHLKCLGPL